MQLWQHIENYGIWFPLMILHLHLHSRAGELAARSHPASAALIWHSCYRFWWVTSCLSPLCILRRPIYLIRISTMISWDISAWWEDVASSGIQNNWRNPQSPKTQNKLRNLTKPDESSGNWRRLKTQFGKTGKCVHTTHTLDVLYS